MRRGVIDRRTTETQIQLTIGLEGRGRYEVHTGIRFLDHMLELFARHGAFDLKVACAGDLDVDQHHTVEDLGIALGEAVTQALGDRRGINRAGYFIMPMDETLAVAAIDLGGRPHVAVERGADEVDCDMGPGPGSCSAAGRSGSSWWVPRWAGLQLSSPRRTSTWPASPQYLHHGSSLVSMLSPPSGDLRSQCSF